MKRLLKAALGQTLFASRIHQLLLRDAGVIVAFHRVSPADRPSGLCIDLELFERYCRFFRRYFHVIPLQELVTRLEDNRDLHRRLVITFDDGYRDNFEHAVPILERCSLPATFFVVTQWIGTDVVPWWDKKRHRQYPWMTWDDVRSLHRRGFDIGAHTRTHADLGLVRDAAARREILGARLELEEQLGAPVASFAYPYGGRDNLTEENRELVKAAGYRCCCSDYGGVNVPGTNPFDLRRVAMSPWCTTPQQFGFEVALGLTIHAA
jgi:peptidoglycan/xylan/chitin deacetylase (PgdA/CDA1 family)